MRQGGTLPTAASAPLVCGNSHGLGTNIFSVYADPENRCTPSLPETSCDMRDVIFLRRTLVLHISSTSKMAVSVCDLHGIITQENVKSQLCFKITCVCRATWERYNCKGAILVVSCMEDRDNIALWSV